MASEDLDLVRLDRISRILENERGNAAFRIENLFRYVFIGEDFRNRELRFSPCTQWGASALYRAIGLIENIVTQYVQLYQDPRVLPVTHYKRQKKLAIHLDQLFAPVLREAVYRSGIESWRDSDGAPVEDPFLDKPILFLKQEARAKGFPRNKKGGGVSRRALRERFQEKLAAKGARISAEWEDEFRRVG